MATTLTSKGQVTIPKQIRDALNLGVGSAIDFAINAMASWCCKKLLNRAHI